MFDLGFFELLVIGIVALIVVGPKDLPVMFRNLGRLTGKARSMAREFTTAMNQAADEAGMRDVQKDLQTLTNPKKAGLDAIQEAADAMQDWDPMAESDAAADRSVKAQTPKPSEGPETAALRAKREGETAAAQQEAERKAAPPEST